MKVFKAARVTLLSTAIALSVTACGDNPPEMTHEEIQYISHLDQARFFQRQGELRASTLEARNAIELQSDEPDPYFIILENLLAAGDAENAERQLDQLLAAMNEHETDITPAIESQASLIRAEANFHQGEFKEALAALQSASFSDRSKQLDAKLLEAKIYHATGNHQQAKEAYEAARDIDNSSSLPLVGLSRLAFSMGNNEEVTAFLEEAENVDPAEPELWLWKGQLFQAREQWEQSEEAYIRALEDIGQFDVMTRRKYETMSSLITVLRAQGKSSEAFVYEEILAKSGPGMIRSSLIAAQEAYNRGDLNEAARNLEEILRQAPGHTQSNLLLGIIRFRQGRVEDAEKLLTPIVEATDSEEASKLLAATRIKLRDPESAKAILANLKDSGSDPSTTALAGIAALASGDLETGETLIRKSLEQNPGNHALRLRFARYLTEVRKFDEAIENAQTVIEASPDNDNARIVQIQALARSGGPEKAISAADRWIEDRPSSQAPLLMRGQLALEADNLKEAETYFDKAQKAFPNTSAPLVALGNMELTRENEDQARDYFKSALELEPDNRQALIGFSQVTSRDETLALMNTLSDIHPDAMGPKLLLLDAALTEGNDKRAEELTAQLLDREEPDLPSASEPAAMNIYSGVAAQIRAENPKRAASILERARVLFPENERIALQAADLAYQSGEKNAARDIIREMKRLHPESANPYLIEASFFERQGENRQASELYELALTKDNAANIHVGYIRSLQADGQTENALQAAENAIEAHPSNPSVLMTSAILFQNLQQISKAVAAYQSLLELTPSNVVALNNLAWIYHEDGDERAMELAKRAYELQPENGAIADTYGWILFKSGRAEESLQVLKKAHELQPDSQEIAMHLAEAYKATGNTDEAKRILEKFGGQG